MIAAGWGMRLAYCIIVVIAAIALGGCASQTPQVTLSKLDLKDPKFASAECSDIRGKAVTYDDKVAERALTGMALGLFLGPFGLPAAASADIAQDEQRHAYNREITLRCVTGGEAIVAKEDAERQANSFKMQAARDQSNELMRRDRLPLGRDAVTPSIPLPPRSPRPRLASLEAETYSAAPSPGAAVWRPVHA
jgi:hypothetical protein